jgi:Ca-activated chloride channel family protein
VSFADRPLLLLAALAPLVVLAGWLWDRQRRRAALSRLGEPALVARLTATSSPGRRALKAVLLGAAGVALGLAAARPQVSGTREVEVRGLDVVIALDVSTSMLVTDMPVPAGTPPPPRGARGGDRGSRLALARRLIGGLVEGLPGDRVGPVVFAAAAAHFPLTEDHEVALQFFDDLGPADLPRGSNVAEALRVSQCLLRKDLAADAGCSATIGRRGNGGRPLAGEREPEPLHDADEDGELIEREERGRVVVVISDGEESDDESSTALAEARKASELGIALVFVGVGSERGGEVYEIDDDGRRLEVRRGPDGQPIISRRGDAAMRALAAAGGDPTRYLVADVTADAQPVIDALDKVSRGIATRKLRQKRDVFHPFVFAAILLLALDSAIGTRRRRRYPEAPAT